MIVPVQLTAEPAGGTFSGDGVSPDGLFDPQMAPIGWNDITYTYEDDLGCINSAMDSIYVDNSLVINESEFGSAKGLYYVTVYLKDENSLPVVVGKEVVLQ